MIQANELRCGNLVMTNNSKYRTNDVGKTARIVSIDSENVFEDKKGTATVYLIDDKYKDTYGQWLHFYEPIPITEEWLLKLGFKKDEYQFTLNKFTIIPKNIKYSYSEGRVFYDNYKTNIIIPDYIHQLQNLYFALTGKELEYVGKD